MTTVKTILFPTDFSDRSTRAFDLACALARDYSANLIAMHVLERPVVVASGAMMAEPPPPPVEDRKAARDRLEQIQPPDNRVQLTHRFEEGDPATAILQVAKEVSADLIVIGTHGRSGLSRLLMGSVAEKVLRNAACPVLSVKTG